MKDMLSWIIANISSSVITTTIQKTCIAQPNTKEIMICICDYLYNGTSLTPEEKEYADEYKACLEDGEISDRERRLLDKIRISLNISVPRATEIENALK